MITIDNFCINRKVAPGLDLKEFIHMVGDLNIKYIELRNDISGKVDNSTILDGYSPEEIKRLLDEEGIRVVDINAQGNMDLDSNLDQNIKSLGEMINIGRILGIKNILFCPVRNKEDTRTNKEKYTQAVENIKVYSQLLKENNMNGLIEPLGFNDSSLKTPWLAQDIIKETGVDNFKLVADNFHYYLAGVSQEDFNSKVDPKMVGLVHLSSVLDKKSREELDDPDRLMPETGDIMNVFNHVKMFEDSPYDGLYSFEPFSPTLYDWNVEDAKRAITHSINLITNS